MIDLDGIQAIGRPIRHCGFDGCINGGQAEYSRVPLANTTLFPAPSSVSDDTLLLMADVFSTR